MASTIPISNTNIPVFLGYESTYGTAATNGYQIAYETCSLVRNQALEANNELRGNRQAGTRIPGAKNPGGTLLFHATDKLLPFGWFATLGNLDAGSIAPQQAPSAVLRAEAGLVTSGDHRYKYVITDDAAGTRASSASNTVTTVEANHGKITVNRPGALPTGWTWGLYRTAVGDQNTYVGVPGATSLAASVTSFVDNVADGSLSGTWPVSFSADDHLHIATVGETLPSFNIERMYPYQNDTAAYFNALGCAVNRATITIKGTGYYDMNLDLLFADLSGPSGASFDATPTDWRAGEKIHHAMALAAKVKLDGSAFGKFQDLTVTHNNNLDTSDYPVGGGGGRGSLVPLQATTQISGTLKVTDPDSLTLVRDSSATHTLSIQHDFASGGHYIKHEIFGVQFDPTDPAPSGQGILKFTANGMASQPEGGQMIQVTMFNAIDNSVYKA